ncbi:MAG: ABC transporter substrate-binding protein [Ruminococcaceae bacterium]|nr:ABC transporter substrate-binding protein [Oscillospiraceae bacterium]
MQDSIYTIPVSEAFEKDCECPICELKSRFENDTVQYYVGPSLMEPDNRIETNKTGFCGRHFSLMYNTQANRLGIGLVLDTYMQEQIKNIEKASKSKRISTKNAFLKNILKKDNTSAEEKTDALVSYLERHEKECCICKKLDYTMDRYIDIILGLFFTENSFKERFVSGKGFCLPHLKILLSKAANNYGEAKYSEFAEAVIKMQIVNLDRIEKEVDWFTKKFDYRNQDVPWGNSRDALMRGINKMTGAEIRE